MHSSRRVRGGCFCTRVAESVTVGHVVSKPLGSPVGLDDVRDPIHRVKTGRVCEGMPRSKRSCVQPIGRSRTFGSGHAEETCRSRIFFPGPWGRDVPIEDLFPRAVRKRPADRGSFTRTIVKRPADRGSFTRTRVKRPADRGSFTRGRVKRPADRGSFTRTRVKRPADRGSFTRTRVKRPADRGSFTRTRVKRPADRGSFPQAVVKRPADRGTFPPAESLNKLSFSSWTVPPL